MSRLFFRWLTALPRPAHRSPRGHRHVPQLETLENRTVPSTLTVTNGGDSGAGSLRAEIAAAKAGDTIVFTPSLDGQTIKLTSGELLINKSLTVQGPGAGQLAISGGNTSTSRLGGGNPNSSRVFEVSGPTTNVTLSGLTITQGNPRTGFAAGYGGGILNDNGSTLTVSGCTLSSNSAAFAGGGIANEEATLTIVNSTLSGNTVSNSSNGGEGGGVYSVGGGTVSMTGCTLTNNSAGESGGGVWIYGTTMTISGCTLSGNVAGNYTGGLTPIPTGNEIYNANTGSDALTVSGSVFVNNTPYRFFPILGPWVNGGGNSGA